jgi:geranylgeranyl reductase family protein
MQSQKEYDVIILGAGPSGATAAMFLKQAGKNVLLVDKVKFPRDKICGDAQGRKAAGVMKMLGIYDSYTKLPGQKIYGIVLSSPNGTQVSIDVESRDKPAPGYTHKRKIFDNFLFDSAIKMSVPFKQFTATDVIIEDDFVKGIVGLNTNNKREEIRAKLVLACDGSLSVVAKKFLLDKNPAEDHIMAVRQYYKGVTGMTDRIEIHLVKHLLPGYFWIFPLHGGETNVGLGMITKDMQKKKINLKDAMLKEIKENPLFADRFKNATPVEDVKGWTLPIASHHRKPYGNGFMLLGDAASLIDPLSGEGVGNAMISAQVAAQVAIEALNAEDFSESFLKQYDKKLWDVIGEEIKANHRIQKTGARFPFLINKVIGKAAKDESFRKRFEKMLPYAGGREELGSDDFRKELEDFEE